jgi:VanZ family protein
MVQKIMKCGFIGGFILFIWGAVAWTILPFQMSQFKKFSDEKSVRFNIKENAPVSGLYTIPSYNYSNQEEMMEAKKHMAEGPFVFAAVMPHGKNPNMAGDMVGNLIVKIIAACLVAWLLFQTRLEYNKSVTFVVVVGLVIGIMATMPYVIWFGFPGMFAISGIIESLFGWFFAGLAMSKMAGK